MDDLFSLVRLLKFAWYAYGRGIPKGYHYVFRGTIAKLIKMYPEPEQQSITYSTGAEFWTKLTKEEKELLESTNKHHLYEWGFPTCQDIVEIVLFIEC